MKKGRRGQSTIEFTILMSFMILMFSVFFVLVGQRLVDLRSERNYEIAKTIQDLVKNEFALARTVEDGYLRKIKLPGAIEGMDYRINITNSTELDIYIGKAELHSRLPTNVSGNISKGMNKITKKSGDIVITPSPYVVTGSFDCPDGDTPTDYMTLPNSCAETESAPCIHLGCTTLNHTWSPTGNWQETCPYRVTGGDPGCEHPNTCYAIPVVLCSINEIYINPNLINSCINISAGQDPYQICGALSCEEYYDGWTGGTCYYKSNIADNTCDGTGTCYTNDSLCPIQGQGASTGITRNICQDTIGCSGTTPPTLAYTAAGTDPLGDCGVGKTCDGFGSCVDAIGNCILGTSLINSCLLV